MTWLDAARSVAQQTRRDFEMVIVDNSGEQRVRRSGAAPPEAIVLDAGRNLGFGAAVNLGFRQSTAPYVATLNDDAVAEPQWLGALVDTMESAPGVGMCASRVLLAGRAALDSAGMLLSGDGSSKQRGHGEPAESYPNPDEVLFPSGSAALFRREMLDQIGLFDDAFFLYCEDTDLGLRARWAGWKCLYAPRAVVEHRYSHSAGRASPLKAYYVERNRLFVIVKNFPPRLLFCAPFQSILRYAWHWWFLMRGRGAAAEFRREGNHPLKLVWLIVRAHAGLFRNWPRLWRQRRQIRSSARLSAEEFTALARRFSLSSREVAAL